MKIRNAIIMFCNITPDCQRMFPFTVKCPVNKFHLWHPVIQEKLKFPLHQFHAPDAGYQYGEIDICEKLNFGTATYHTCHTLYTLNTAAINQKKETYLNEAGETVSNYNQGIAQDAMLPGAFNVFSVEITDDQIVWYVNDTPVHVYKHFVHTAEDPLSSQLKPQEQEWYFKSIT